MPLPVRALKIAGREKMSSVWTSSERCAFDLASGKKQVKRKEGPGKGGLQERADVAERLRETD